MTRIFKLFKRDERGISAIEYVFLAIGIGLVVLAASMTVGTAIQDRFNTLANSIDG